MRLGSILTGVRSEAHAWRYEPLKRVKMRAGIMRPWRRLRFRSFGSGSILHKPDWLYGTHLIEVGEQVIMLGPGIKLTVERPAWEADKPALQIGSGSTVAPYCTLSAAESIVIEEYVGISAFVTIIDSEHTWSGDSEHVLWNPVLTSPIRIGRGTMIGERTTVLRGANVGRFCLIGANSVVKGDIPDFSIAVGAPARVVGSTEKDTRKFIER